MDNYSCEICGKNHQVYVSLEIPSPRIISNMSEEERKKRVKEIKDFAYVDDEMMFANGWVSIEFENHESPFYYWKTWTSISKSKFLNNIDKLKKGLVIELDGQLEEELPFYPGSYQLKTKTLIQAYQDGFIVEIRAIEDSQLKHDQSKPITEKRVIEIMQMIHHNPENEKRRKNLNISFKDRLSEILDLASVKYINNKKDFVLDISSNEGLFQVISNQMLEAKGETNGFAIDLAFDDSFEESKKQIQRFKQQKYSKDFTFNVIDNIPTYQLNLNNDKDKIRELVIKIIQDVYNEKLETTEVTHFEI